MNIHSLLPYVAVMARPIAIAVAHHFGHGKLHHVLEHGLHHLTHRWHFAHNLVSKCPWLADRLIDSALILAIMAFGAVTEGHEAEAGSEPHE
jgi:hypothetical protein